MNKKGKVKSVVKKVKKNAKSVAESGKKFAEKKYEEIFKILDCNADGKIDANDIVLIALKTPGIRVDREDFLKKTLSNKYPKEIVYKAVKSNPKNAGIEYSDVEGIADDSIEFERRCATSGSVVLGIPGGVALTATLPIDIVQYFAFLLRVAQKLMYIYGYGELNIKEGKEVDESTVKILVMCLSVMLGVQGADTALRTAMPIWAKGVQAGLKESSNILKYGFKAFVPGFENLVFSGVVKLFPLIGGVVSGSLTYTMFKISCNRLRKVLKENPLNVKKDVNIKKRKKDNKLNNRLV